MLKHYLSIAFRNLWKNKIFSFINISGLSVGLACCMLIFLYAKDEVSFDRFHKNTEKIYRITATMVEPTGNVFKTGNTGMMPGPNFKNQIPEIQDFVRVQSDRYTVKQNNQAYYQPALAVDENFFSVFSFPLLHGDPKTALSDPHNIVLSEKIAQKYFGNTNVVGKTLQLQIKDKFEPFVIAGITKNSPQNSSIQIEMLMPMKFRQLQYDDQEWVNFFLNTFLLIPPGSNIKAIETRMNQVFNKEAAVQLNQMKEKYDYNTKVIFGLQSLAQMHLSKDFKADNGLSRASNPMYSYILLGIALFILLIGCINFINLTIAQSLKRSKEIGIRKVVGGERGQLVFQFLGESFMLALIAFVLGLGLVQISLPFFNKLSDKELAFSYLLDWRLILIYIGLFLTTGLMAGFYPALVLSKFDPVETLYKRRFFTNKNYLFKGLTVFQFVLSTFLIIATITIYKQFDYLVNFDLGYNDKNVAVITTGQMNRPKLELFRNELLKNPSIQMVSADQGGTWETRAHINGEHDAEFDFKIIDGNYFPLLKIPVVKGRNFSNQFSSDTAQGAMVNESFVKMAGWKDPIGQVVDFFYNNKKYYVIGVVKDYHYADLNQKIGPQVFLAHPSYPYRDVYAKLSGQNTAEAMNYISTAFKKVFPFQPYSYSFKEESNEKQYASEQKWKQVISFGALLTIFISCIGLLGLAVLSGEKRTKEIGIRKVLGASVASIAQKLSADFLKLVLIASIIAIPVAWYTMNHWLQNYPYRISINGWMMLVAILFILAIALFTVGIQSVKAAMANPVKNLRTE